MDFNKLKQQVSSFIKKEAVLCISLALALSSIFIIPPTIGYLEYIDFRVLALLLCLMLVVAGWQKTGAFYALGQLLSSKAHTTRGITYILVSLCFFSSMLITNDVALITFIPFTITLLSMGDCNEKLIPVIVLETIAANLGSMLTPIGNPQNLFLFSLSGMSVSSFILHMFPLTAASFLLLGVIIQLQKSLSFTITSNALQTDKPTLSSTPVFKSKLFWISSLLFAVCLANVFHILSYPVVLVIVAFTILISDRSLFKSVDYSLLLTFVALFVFIGNMGQIPWIKQTLESIIFGRELAVGILSSQVISNVPAAMLLAKFTDNYPALLWGVNIGGLGTMIASMASLISYKYYANSHDARKGSYFLVFTLYNLMMLILLVCFAFALMS